MIKFEEVNNIRELAVLADEIWHEYWTCILSEEQINYMVNEFQSEKSINKQIKNENYIYFYIISDGKKTGYIGLSKRKEYLFLSKFYIKKEYRHKGIGSIAFNFIKDFAVKESYKQIILTVNKHNKNTISASNKWGFKTIESVVTDIGNGFAMDDYIMKYVIE